MSQDAEKIKRLVSFKQKLEKRVEELELELKELQATLEALNFILLEKGFKRAEITKPPTEIEALVPKEEVTVEPSPPLPPTEYESVIPLKTVTGELLATLHVSEDSLRVVPAEDKSFNVNTPPFTPFLVERVFAKMQEKDNELARTGQITQEKILCYNIVREGEVIREITIKHVDQDRLRELKSSIRWTLEKMYEKMKSQS
ncbi:MAG: hypothetical protein OEZ18_05165 [Candidatus Bathyarchaeota archaeon]|nr:hypothetical protein [Candidatus Bathyarchaeota archaeon]